MSESGHTHCALVERPSGIDDDLYIVTQILQASTTDSYAYERDDIWYVGIGNHASVSVSANGANVTTIADNKATSGPLEPSIVEVARDFLSKHDPAKSNLIFGNVAFDYTAFSENRDFTPGTWPLLTLMIPTVQITFAPGKIVMLGYSDQLYEIQRLIEGLRWQPRADQSLTVDVYCSSEKYVNLVKQGLSEIKAGKYQKVILSRAIDLDRRVDMIATLYKGRQGNTPKRSFIMNHLGYEATGFSPELVVSVKNHTVETEPLAGTRAYTGSAAERRKLTNDLETDPKEIVEHSISVKAAVKEMSQVCREGSINVTEFMEPRVRGNVQHLGSRVVGRLGGEKDEWDAFDALFPSITASGIPKTEALGAIERLEQRPRELYSGAILMLDRAKGLFEASLVLRTVFQHGNKSWVQAGAGVIEQSKPEREFTETCEKLSTITPFVVPATPGTENGANGHD